MGFLPNSPTAWVLIHHRLSNTRLLAFQIKANPEKHFGVRRMKFIKLVYFFYIIKITNTIKNGWNRFCKTCSNMTFFKCFELTPVVNYEYILFGSFEHTTP